MEQQNPKKKKKKNMTLAFLLFKQYLVWSPGIDWLIVFLSQSSIEFNGSHFLGHILNLCIKHLITKKQKI